MADQQTSAAGRAALKGLVGPAVATLLALAFLIGLGTWQLQRLAWKEDLIASIQKSLDAAPVPLETPVNAWKALGFTEYQPVTVAGRFRHGEERHVFAIADGEPGWYVVTPLETEGGHIVFVNRGFVPDALKDPKTRAQGQVEGVVTVTGLVRHAGTKGTFDQDPDLARNIWYWRDLGAMASSVGLAAEPDKIIPYFVEAKAEPANPGGWPKGGVTRVDLPNRHLEYALTWFGLAATLAAVFAAFAWSRLRGPKGDQG
jgi:surfeit locus 1 family protein